MKILYITAEGFDTPNPNNQMAEVIIRDLLSAGHAVHLIQSHRKGVFDDVPASLKDAENLTVDTVTRKVVDKSNFVRRYLNDVRYAFLAKKRWKKVKDADVIYLQSNPTVIYPMLLLRLFKRKTPIVYSVYDVFPGHAYDIGVIKSKLLYNIFRILQKPCYRKAAETTVLSEDMKEKIVQQGGSPEHIHVVPAWYDTKNTREIPPEENRFLQKYGLKKERFTVQFAGSLGYVFDYKTVLQVALRLRDCADIEFQIIGDGPIKNEFMTEATALGLNNISFFPLQPIEIVPDVYSACDVCIIPLKKGVIGNGVPSKAPILMACKRVIVNSVEAQSEYAKSFTEHNMGVSVDIGNYDGIARAVLDLKNSPEKVKKMAENAYEYVTKNHSSDLSTSRLLQILSSAAASRKRK